MLVTIAQYFDPTEAHIVRALLESAGIPASVADANHVTANWPLAVALGGVRVQVPEQFRDQARDLVAAYVSGDLEKDLEHEVASCCEKCPSCGSGQITKIVPVRAKICAVAIFLFAGATYPTRTSKFICTSCGHVFREQV